MNTTLQQIRKQLRLAMNGIISTSLREKGMNYKIIFGTPVPEIKQIAAAYTPDVELAVSLWNEDVRELKILATLLYPAEALDETTAQRWIAEAPYHEIAEQLSANLLPFMPEREALILACLREKEPKEFTRVCGFLTWANLSIRNIPISEAVEQELLVEAKHSLDQGVSLTQRAASLALKRYGRRSKAHAEEVIKLVAGYENCGRAEQEEFLHDLKFEFEYYFEE